MFCYADRIEYLLLLSTHYANSLTFDERIGSVTLGKWTEIQRGEILCTTFLIRNASPWASRQDELRLDSRLPEHSETDFAVSFHHICTVFSGASWRRTSHGRL